MKSEIKIGQKIDTYYGNGTYCCEKEVTRVTEKSVFYGRQRESHNTFWNNVRTGIYKLK